MSFSELSAGAGAPEEVNVIVEIPMFGSPVKYEVDKRSGLLSVDRFLNTAMYYPCNYGYIPATLAEDGDPMDVLIIAPVPLLHGSIIKTRPVGMLAMEDESGNDVKIIAVPISKLSRSYDAIQEASDLGEHMLATIQHFFEHYKDLEAGKWVRVQGWRSSTEAKSMIAEAQVRYRLGEGQSHEGL